MDIQERLEELEMRVARLEQLGPPKVDPDVNPLIQFDGGKLTFDITITFPDGSIVQRGSPDVYIDIPSVSAVDVMERLLKNDLFLHHLAHIIRQKAMEELV